MRNVQPTILGSLAVLTLGSWAFIEVAGEMIEGDADALDRWLLLALRMPEDPTNLCSGDWVGGSPVMRPRSAVSLSRHLRQSLQWAFWDCAIVVAWLSCSPCRPAEEH